MTTFSYSQLEPDAISSIDWYLIEPIGPSLFDFTSVVPEVIYEDLIKTYGRFWISNEGLIKYRRSQCPSHLEWSESDVTVKNITMGHCLGGNPIVRVNGIVIPTIALEQLRILLRSGQKNRFNTYSNLLHNLDSHQTDFR